MVSFKVRADGSLDELGSTVGVAATATGLVVR
jgi:hypothetical protein